MKEKEKSSRFSKGIVLTVIVLCILFTIAILYVFTKVGSEPSTLIQFFFGTLIVELWKLADIKKEKIKKNENNN